VSWYKEPVQRWRIVAATFVCASALAACGNSGGSSAPSTASPSTASATPSPTPLSGSARAGQVVDDLAAGKYAEVEAQFDATMKAQLPLAALQTSWTTYEQLLGPYKSHDQPASVMKGDLDVERVTVTMTNGAGEVRITLHADGTIAGLFFLKAGAPPP
jgi:hypothetical protein